MDECAQAEAVGARAVGTDGGHSASDSLSLCTARQSRELRELRELTECQSQMLYSGVLAHGTPLVSVRHPSSTVCHPLLLASPPARTQLSGPRPRINRHAVLHVPPPRSLRQPPVQKVVIHGFWGEL